MGPSVQRVYGRGDDPLAGVVRPAGACVPAASNLFAVPSGALHMCPQVTGGMSVGDVWRGIDDATCVRLATDYALTAGPECVGCWALRMCTECIRSARTGETFSGEHLRASCQRLRRGLDRALRTYTLGIRRDPDLWARHFADKAAPAEPM